MSKVSQADRLLSYVEKTGATYFHTTLGEAYVVVPFDGHKEWYPVISDACKKWLRRLFYNEEKRSINDISIKDVLSTMSAKAEFDNIEPVTLFNRVAKVDNTTFWYDLTNANWEAVEITEEGWSVKPSPCLFMRYKHHISQATPEDGGDAWDIFDFIPLKKHQLLFLCWLITCYIPDIPHPLTVFYGEQGAAKTTTNEFIKSLVDPTQLDTMKLANDMDSLFVNLQRNWFLPFDNVSKISVDVSDTLCGGVTGTAVQKRKKYTDGDDYIFKFIRCMSINCINNVVLRPDLLDRSLLFQIERISEENREELSKIKGEFAQRKPKILGSIMETLRKAMAIYPTVKLERLPRMADFTRWGYAIAEAIGTGKGEQFLKEYEENRKHQNEEAIDADPIASLVLDFMEAHKDDKWEGIVSKLHDDLSTFASSQNINTRLIKFPALPNQLSKHMNRIKTNLEVAGIQYVNHGHKRTGTEITLIKNISEDKKAPGNNKTHETIKDTAIQVDAGIPETQEETTTPDAPKSKKSATAPALSKSEVSKRIKPEVTPESSKPSQQKAG